MKKSVRGGLTYANVTATLALFVALGGSAYAALSIDGGDVVDGSLSGRDVRDGSLGRADFSEQLANAARRRGRRGPRGRRGAQGPPGVTRVTVREGAIADCIDPACAAPEAINSVRCDPGQHVVGGGAAAPQDAMLVSTGPSPDTSGGTPTGWQAKARATSGALQTTPRVWVLCASP